MATGKSGTIAATPKYGYGVEIDWSEEYSINENTSTVTAKVYITYNYIGKIGRRTVSCTINGVTQTANISITEDYSPDIVRRRLVGTFSQSGIAHNATTGAASITISATFPFNLYDSYGRYVGDVTASGEVILTTIPRVSPVYASDGYIGSAISITINKTVSSFTHTLKYSFAGEEGTIVSKTAASSYSWTPPMSLCSNIPNAEYANCTITCETYSGSTLIGSKTCTVRLTVPASVLLTCSSGWATVSPYNTGTKAEGINNYVKGYSRAAVTFDSSKISTANSYGATIASYKIVYGGSTFTSPYRTGTITDKGTKAVSCYVVDSRNRSVKIDLSFTVLDYYNPTVSDIEVFRCLSNGDASVSGQYVSVKASVTYSSLSGLNSFTIRARIKPVNGAYGSYTNLESGAASVIGGGSVLINASYVVEISVYDALNNSYVYTTTIPTTTVLLNGRPGDKGIAFGKYAEEDNLFESAWPMKIEGETMQDFVVEQGITDIWTWRKWKSGIAECWGTWSGTLTHYTTTNGFYAYYTSVSFPSGLFSASPIPTYSAGVGSAFAIPGNLGNLSNTAMNCYALVSSGGEQTVKFCIHACGTWK